MPAEKKGSQDMQPRIVAIGVVALIAVVGLLYWLISSDEPPPPAADHPPAVEEDVATPVPEPISSDTPIAQPPPPLPPLNESDDFVREQVLTLSERLGDWLSRDELVRRFAVVIDNAALGEIPRRQLGFLAPTGKFQVREEGGKTFVDPAGYARFDTTVDTIVSLPPEQAAVLLRTFAPMLREALAELGHRDPDPLGAVRAGIRQALQTPEPDGDIELVQPKVFYQYADQGLESLPPLQKQLLRMGPANVARLKTYLREVQSYL